MCTLEGRPPSPPKLMVRWVGSILFNNVKTIDQIIKNQLLVDNRWSSKALKNLDILLSLRFGIFEKSPLGDFLERFEKKSPNQSSCTDLVQCAFGTFGWKIFPGGILS